MISKLFCRSFSSVTRKKNLWTIEKVVKSPYKDVDIPKMTVYEYVFRNLDRWATKTAVVCGITNRSYTYEQVYKQSRILGANLRKKFKIKDGDTIAIMLQNSPEYPVAVFAVLAAGGIVTTLNPVYTSYEIKRQLDISNATLVISHPDLIPNIRIALELSKKDTKIIAVNIDKIAPEGSISYKELVEDNNVDLSTLNEVKRVDEDVALLPFSSGTTGLPKAVELTNRNMVVNSQQQNTEFRQYSYTTGIHQDTTLSILPMFHSYGLCVQLLHKMSVGLQFVTLPRFQPDTFLHALLAYRINLLYLAPPLVLFLGSHPESTPKHLAHVDLVVSGAAPLPSADIQRFLDKAGREINFCHGYGMTEAGPLVSLSPIGDKHYEDVGYALPNISLKVVDGEMTNLGHGEIGELLIKGPNVMKGYKDNPEANREVFVDDGWLRSGDLAKIDEFGRITIVDRLKELIKVKGHQVPPAELENELKEHPDIFDVAVVGVPDSNTGEAPQAFVVLKPGSTATEKQIIGFISNRVAPYKRIKDVMFIDSIPKNPSGKILRKVLKEKYC